MYLIMLISLFSLTSHSKELTNCQKEESESLWVENHQCDEGLVQVGHGLITSSVVTSRNRKTNIEFDETKNNKVNFKYLRQMRNLKN